MKRLLTIVALLLSVAAPAAAQTPSRVHLSFGYRYLQAQWTNRMTDSHPVAKRLGVGGEISATVRVAPLVSLVGAIGSSSSRGITVPKGGLPLNSTETGTVTFSVTDIMGGAKLSRAESGPFVELLAGASMPGARFHNVSGAGQSLISFDQGKRDSFALRPVAGVDLRTPSHRVGARLEAGWDIIFGVERAGATAEESVTVTHFRFVASVTVALGR